MGRQTKQQYPLRYCNEDEPQGAQKAPFRAGSDYFDLVKVYDVEGNAVRAAEVVPTDGFGHGALAGFLRERGVEALICGGIGGGAIAALADAGVRVYAGVSGSADGAVQAFLRGELSEGAEATCSHHGHGGKEEGCGHGEHGGCGHDHAHGCGGHEEGCGGTCH